MNRYRVGYARKLIRAAHQDAFHFSITNVPCTCCLSSDRVVAQIGKRVAKGFICADCLDIVDGKTTETEIIKSVLE